MTDLLSRGATTLCAALFAVAVATTAEGVLVVTSYSASAGPGADPDANIAGGGTIDLWDVTLTSGDGGQNGSFQGDSGSNGTGSVAGAGSSAWALYANSGQTATATADLSGFTDALASISIQFDNGFIEGGGRTGVRFKSGSTTASEFSFTNDGSNSYAITDDAGVFLTGIGFTADGFTVELDFDQTTAGEYDLNLTGSSTASFMDRVLTGGATDITSIEVYNFNAGGGGERNVFFDNLVVSAVPEATPVLLLSALSALGLARGRRG